VEVDGQIHDPVALHPPSPPGKRTLVPIDWEADYVPANVWTFQYRELCLIPSENWTPNYPAGSSVTICLRCMLGTAVREIRFAVLEQVVLLPIW